jgi:N-acetylmuramoyl-L-alanine amidase
VDKTDSGPRSGAWEGPERQLTGCALRFKFWYRGRDGVTTDGRAPDAWKNWLGLREDPRFAPDVAVTRDGLTIVPGNQASADCLRFTSSLPASLRLREIGLRWFPEDYLEEEQRVMSRETVIVLDPGHSDYTHEFPGGYREGVLVRQAALKAQQLLTAEGHRCYLTRTQAGEDPSLTSRGKLAVEKGARVFVSMHTDASDSEQARGVHAIFYARNKSEASAPDSEVCAPRGRALARAVAQEVASALGLPLRNAATGGAAPWWRCPENLTVLTAGENWRKTEAACLVEGGFGSSPEDRAVLSRADAPERYALGVCRGIYRYCGWAYPSAWATGGMAEQQPVPAPETTAPVNAWAKEIADAVAWAKLRGVSDGTRLDDPLTRAEALVMLRRLEGDVS